ncbi:MAG: SpoIIE family protein phosphatase [Acidobacteria bacterium]|nr:SpoIIE family protein phosphatase [Acidobacteriota bacterium]
MSVRARLVLAFLLFAVVPLAVVSLYSYTSSLRAFRSAVAAEATAAAGQMGDRMKIVTEGLGRWMDRLDPERLRALARSADGPSPEDREIADALADQLGEAADIVEQVGVVPVPPQPPEPGSPTATTPPAITIDIGKVFSFRGPPVAGQPDVPVQIAIPQLPAEALAALAQAQKQLEKLRADGASGLSELQQREIEKSSRVVRRQLRQVEGRGAVLENDDPRGGKVWARVNLDRMLQRVVGMSHSDEGEIPFAIDGNGKLTTPAPEQARQLEALDLPGRVRRAGAEALNIRTDEWVVVTRLDPESGVTFGIARPVQAALAEIRRTAGRNFALGMMVIGLALLGIVPLSARMTRNLSTLTEGANRIAEGDLEARVPVRSRDEFGQLAQTFNHMAQGLKAHQQDLIEQERLRRELELCRQIQAEMLPKGPLRAGLAEVKGVSIPARQVGGDFFNYFVLPEGQLALLVGDVSGKGISAALLMANIQATLRARMPLEQDLARLLEALDREIEANTPVEVYLTLFIAILECDRGRLRYVNAGHNTPLLLRDAGGVENLPATGLPLGLYSGQGYAERSVEIGSGDLLFFYTDGITELQNEHGEPFGAERLQQLVAASQHEGVDAVLASVEKAAREFRGAAEPFDDGTMMVLRCDGA